MREYDRILRNTRNVTSWVHQEMKRIAEIARVAPEAATPRGSGLQ
jgi:hypothetical protein